MTPSSNFECWPLHLIHWTILKRWFLTMKQNNWAHCRSSSRHVIVVSLKLRSCACENHHIQRHQKHSLWRQGMSNAACSIDLSGVGCCSAIHHKLGGFHKRKCPKVFGKDLQNRKAGVCWCLQNKGHQQNIQRLWTSMCSSPSGWWKRSKTTYRAVRA